MTITTPPPLDIVSIMYASVALAIGVVMLGWGCRFFRTVIALAGFAASAVLSFILLANIEERVGWGRWGREIVLAGSVVAGLAGAAVSLWIWMVAVAGVGALGGGGLAVWVAGWRLGVLEEGAPWVKPAFIAGMAALGALLAVVYEKAVIVVATAVAGSVGACSAVDVFLKTGFNDEMRALLVNKGLPQPLEGKTMAMLVSCGALAVAGILFQYTVTGNESRRKTSIQC